MGGPLLRLDALTRVPGFTDSILDRLAPFATVHGDGRVNVNTAPTEVLAAIPGIGADGAASIIAARESGPLASAIAIAPHLRGRRTDGGIGPVGTEPSRILVVSRGWAAGHPSTREIQVVFEVVRGFLDAPTRLRVRHWVERDR